MPFQGMGEKNNGVESTGPKTDHVGASPGPAIILGAQWLCAGYSELIVPSCRFVETAV